MKKLSLWLPLVAGLVILVFFQNCGEDVDVEAFKDQGSVAPDPEAAMITITKSPISLTATEGTQFFIDMDFTLDKGDPALTSVTWHKQGQDSVVLGTEKILRLTPDANAAGKYYAKVVNGSTEVLTGVANISLRRPSAYIGVGDICGPNANGMCRRYYIFRDDSDWAIWTSRHLCPIVTGVGDAILNETAMNQLTATEGSANFQLINTFVGGDPRDWFWDQALNPDAWRRAVDGCTRCQGYKLKAVVCDYTIRVQ